MTVKIIVVEHKDRLTCFGFKYIETLLAVQGRSIEVVNLAENPIEDLLADLVSIIYNFSSRLYGQRRVKANMGKRNNQNFVQIPHARFIAMLTYKAELVGITVKVTEESYTSKASLLDLDPLPVRDPNNGSEKHTFRGKRVKRGLYRASDGRKINADINGAGNVIRKVAPDAFGLRVVEDGKAVLASLVVHPVRIVVPLTKPKDKHLRVKASGQENALFR